MELGRIFVTSVIILGMAGAVACNRHRVDREHAGQTEKERKDALVNEGNSKINESREIKKDLRKFKIALAEDAKSITTTAAASETFDWINMTPDDRREVQAKLARFLQLVNRVFEIDAQKLIIVERREMVISERESAEAFQRSLEKFIKLRGINYTAKHTNKLNGIKTTGI